MILMIDNYDSFTYNLVQYLGELGQEVKVVRNDHITLNDIEALQPDYLMLSPGPCTPNEAGICLDAVTHFAGKLPILGICLGHQTIGQAFGGKIIKAKEIMHGKTSPVYHHDEHVFANCEQPFTATRYHSLVVEQASLPDCLQVTAWTNDDDGKLDEIMGIRHKDFAIEGVQFHPESILTQHGHHLLNNFIEQNAN